MTALQLPVRFRHEHGLRHEHGGRSQTAHALLLGLTVAFACVGCGGEDWQAATYPARGKITINGEPPAGAVVELHSTGEQPDMRNSRPWAVVQEDGSFSLSTYETGDGAPPGDYKVVVRWPPDVTQPSLVDRLSGAYSSSERSRWTVSITEGENDVPPIEITGAKVLPKAQPADSGRTPPGPMMTNRGR